MERKLNQEEKKDEKGEVIYNAEVGLHWTAAAGILVAQLKECKQSDRPPVQMLAFQKVRFQLQEVKYKKKHLSCHHFDTRLKVFYFTLSNTYCISSQHYTLIL